MLGIFTNIFAVDNEAMAQLPMGFSSYASNPVLTHGAMGSYDGTLLISPYAVLKDGIFYIFYTGNGGVCLATSPDGYTFSKYSGNPVLTPSAIGFDSYWAGDGKILETGSGWVMYYNATEVSTIGPGRFVGRATSDSLTGIWERLDSPVLTVGGTGEWDAGFVLASSILPQDTGGFIMFFSGADDFLAGHFQIGLATSPDGITWTKYNDPATILPPFAESDPVLKVGDPGDWDDQIAWECSVVRKPGYYEMYYTGSSDNYHIQIGYAWSTDGIAWKKFTANPVYSPSDDPYAVANGLTAFQQPSLLVYNGKVFMYYDYGIIENSIGMATALPDGLNEGRITKDELQFAISPNPLAQSTTFSYFLKEPERVTVRIFNSFGQIVSEPLNATQTKGEQKVTWNTENLPSGIYLCHIRAGREVAEGKMIIVK